MTSWITKNGEIYLLLLMKADGDLFKMCLFYSANSKKKTTHRYPFYYNMTQDKQEEEKERSWNKQTFGFFSLENDSLIFAMLIWIFLSFRLLVGQKRKSGKFMHIIKTGRVWATCKTYILMSIVKPAGVVCQRTAHSLPENYSAMMMMIHPSETDCSQPFMIQKKWFKGLPVEVQHFF